MYPVEKTKSKTDEHRSRKSFSSDRDSHAVRKDGSNANRSDSDKVAKKSEAVEIGDRSNAGFRVPTTPPRFIAESEESRKSILNDVQVPTTCTPHNLRFVGAVEMLALCLAAAKGDQKTPLNFFAYKPGCPWCKSAFPEYLGAAWIAACRPNDGPFYAVSSNTMRDEEGNAVKRDLDIRTFPALFRVEGDRVIKLNDPSQRTVAGFLDFFKRKLGQ